MSDLVWSVCFPLINSTPVLILAFQLFTEAPSLVTMHTLPEHSDFRYEGVL